MKNLNLSDNQLKEITEFMKKEIIKVLKSMGDYDKSIKFDFDSSIKNKLLNNLDVIFMPNVMRCISTMVSMEYILSSVNFNYK